MKKLLTLLALASVAHAQPAAMVVPANETPPPIIRLPVEKPVNVSKYDPNEVKARDLPYHVTLTKAPEAWAKNPLARGKGLKIAVVDTWGQPDHPGFHGMVKGTYSAITKKLNPPRPAKPNPHCTHCAGIVHSMLPEAELYLIEGMGSDGSGTTADLAHGIDYAVTGFKCDVVSCSFGGPSTDPFLPAAIRRACDAGAIVVCAAGNDGGGPGRDTEGYPARYEGATSVAACDSNRKLAAFSSWGPTVFTTKPGVNVTSFLPDNQEGEMSGTSMACPCEVGTAGMWANTAGGAKDKDRWKRYREAVVKASPFTERNNARGYGMYTADKIVAEPSAPTPPPPPAPGEKVYTVSVADLQRQGYTSIRLDLATPAGGGTQTIPVMSVPGTVGQPFAPPPVIYHQPAPVFAPPPVVYSPMPTACPGGVCQPQPAPLFPVLRSWVGR